MPVYDAAGNQLSRVYDAAGNQLSSAYDAAGNLVYSISGVNLKVMTYNVGGWYIGSGDNVPSNKDAQYYALQTAIIGGQDADILCLEEYWDAFSKAGRTALSLLEQYYPYIHTENGTNQYFGRAICSKYPITGYYTNAFANESARYFDRATINVNGLIVNVLVTHLGLTTANRQPQALQIFNYVQNYENVILCGDFNIPVTSTSDSEFVNCYQQFVNAGYYLGQGGDFGFTDTSQDPSTLEWFGIDQIITSENLRICSVYTDQTKLTDSIDERIDHIPFIANITLYTPNTFSILGDSYSTYDGYTNLKEGYRAWYPTNGNLTSVDQTWWKLFEAQSGLELAVNESFSGTCICYDGYGTGTDDQRDNNESFLKRMSFLEYPQYVFIFGGTNDSWIPVNVGTYKYSDWTETDKESFRPALACLIDSVKKMYKLSTVIFIKNTGLGSSFSESIDTICEHYDVQVIALSSIDKSDGHPTVTGMAQIANQVESALEL